MATYPMYENNLKQWLLPLIKERGLKVEEFANQCGLSRAALYNYFTDLNRPDVETMTKICRVLGVPVEEGLCQYTPRAEGRPKKVNQS